MIQRFLQTWFNTNATAIKNLPAGKFDELQHESMSNRVGQQETNLNDSIVPDEHPCSGNPCLHGGNCTVYKDSFQCQLVRYFLTSLESTCEKWRARDALFLSDLTYLILIPFQNVKKSYYGILCENDPCSENPCLNGGECKMSDNSFLCKCPTPYSGIICEKEPVDPCSQNPCLNGGQCVVSGDSFLCKCPTPYSGITCEKDPCSENPCLNGGQCVVSGDSFLCNCPRSYYGILCENDPCSENPCLNGGECKMSDNSFLCKCPTPYSGIICEKEPVDPCSQNPCLNGGQCVVSGDSFLCKCPTPYSGITCEKGKINAFL
ncbi:hypothetical protein TNCT_525171 [Trichonephila clavata]|uniref:EGF-like domain-containing protein n=1 Tax=Trichonephila clavata TaxID=2740835 RepID=A0A8X6JJK0_TRICU|nr:hypothetical protein TNCT_525171 [Trichonephila clavata]